MATSGKQVADYDWDFVDPPSIEFDCQLCRQVLREPVLVECCGHFCRACIEPFIKEGKPCPSCGAANFRSLRDKKTERRIFEVDVNCPMNRRGCLWVGELGKRGEHLEGEDGCEFFDLPCSAGCGESVQRRHLPEHLASLCPKRAYLCGHCDFKATYEIVSDQHWPQCAKFPLACPNECGVSPIERCMLDQHIRECPLQKAECDFGYAGCRAKMQRQELPQHLQENAQNHLTLMSAMIVKSSQEQQRSLARLQQDMGAQIAQLQEQKDKQIAEIQETLRAKEVQILELISLLQGLVTENKVLSVRVRDLEDLSCKLQFVMQNINNYKGTTSKSWYSPHFYSYTNKGYKLQLQVVVSSNVGEGVTAIYLYQMDGEFDTDLKWPLKIQASVQLVDVAHGHMPYVKTMTGHCNKKGKACVCGWRPFITHTELDNYINEDALHFRVNLALDYSMH